MHTNLTAFIAMNKNLVPFSFIGSDGQVPAEALSTFTRKRDAVTAAGPLNEAYRKGDRSEALMSALDVQMRIIRNANRRIKSKGWYFYPAATKAVA